MSGNFAAEQVGMSALHMSAISDMCWFWITVSIGATGAPTINSTLSKDNAFKFTITRTGVGTYDVTHPKGKRSFVDWCITSSALTVDSFVTTARNANAGTFTMKAAKAGVATEMANGDILEIMIAVEK